MQSSPQLIRLPLRTPWRTPLRQLEQRIDRSCPPPLRANKQQTRCFRLSARRTEGELQPRESFRGQLYDTTYQRVQRERIAEEEMIERRNAAEGPTMSLKSFALTFVCLVIGGVSYRMGYISPKEPFPRNSTTPIETAQPPILYPADVQLQSAWVDFIKIVGKPHVSTDPADLDGHAGSEWSTYQTQPGERPFMILYPATTEEVSKIMKLCHLRKLAVVPISGGTSLEGHFAATRGRVYIDFMRMDQIKALHVEDLDVVVEPGIGWEELNETLAEHNLFFPPDPGPGAKIGGMVGTGCSGTNAYRYGTMKDWVLSLTVVMADGTIVKTRQRPRKSSAGYDLTRLFIGSEGTLGIVTEATLKVTPKPKKETVVVASFPNIRAAARCASMVVREGIQAAGIEIMDDEQMRFTNKSGRTSRRWEEAPTLFFKFGGSAAAVEEQVESVKKLAFQCMSKSFEFAKNDDEARELWSARKEALWSVMAMKGEGDHVWTTDVAVPISRLPDIIEQTKEDITESGLVSGIVGHVGDGNFHAIILFNEQERDKAEDVVHRMVKRAVEMEGTVTGEHGVGLIKRDYLEHEMGITAVDTMRRIKQALDPMSLLNCDKVIRIDPPQTGEVPEW